MIELRHNTQQTVVVGFVTPSVSKLVRSDWSVIDLSGHTWMPVPGCPDWYFLVLPASNINIMGHAAIYPRGTELSIISQSMWDAKYSDNLLTTKISAQKG